MFREVSLVEVFQVDFYVEIITIIIIVDAVLKLFKNSIMTKFLSLKVLSSKLHIETRSQKLNLVRKPIDDSKRSIHKMDKRH